MLCVVFSKSLKPRTTYIYLFDVKLPKSVFGFDSIPNTDLNGRYAECCISIHSHPKNWTYSVFDSVNNCFEICLWIPLTMVNFLPLYCALLKIRIPTLAFNCSYANAVIDKILNPFTFCGIRWNLRVPLTNFADYTYICGFYLHFVESTYSCWIQNN